MPTETLLTQEEINTYNSPIWNSTELLPEDEIIDIDEEFDPVIRQMLYQYENDMLNQYC